MTDTNDAEILVRLGQLDQRESTHHEGLAKALAEVRVRVDQLGTLVGKQGEVLGDLHGVAEAVAELQEQVRSLLPPNVPEDRYWPVPTPQWWDYSAEQREEALQRIRGWVEHIYRPYYGELSKGLGVCWESHPFCIITLDWLAEFWNLLYLNANRVPGTVTAQGDFSTRILLPAARQLIEETSSCNHPKVAVTTGITGLAEGFGG